MDEYLDDGGWEGEAKEEWRKEFLENIDTSKDGFLDRDEVAGTFSLFQWMSSIVSILSKMTFFQVRAWIVPVPGEFHAAEAAHLVAASDLNGDQILTKEEVVDSPKYRYLRHIVFYTSLKG